MSWISMILAGIQLLGKVTDFLVARQAITAADADHVQAVLNAAKDKSDEITKEMDAAAARASERLPDGTQPKDPYQRD